MLVLVEEIGLNIEPLSHDGELIGSREGQSIEPLPNGFTGNSLAVVSAQIKFVRDEVGRRNSVIALL